MTIDVKLLRDWDDVARDADGALDRARQPSLFDRLEWHRLIAALGGVSGDTLVARARDADGATWLPLLIHGRQGQPHANWYTLAFDAIGKRSLKPLSSIVKALKDQLDMLSLSPVPPNSLLPSALRESGWIVREWAATVRWEVDTRDGFDAYWSRRPGQLRSTFKRKAKAAALDIVIHRAFELEGWAAYDQVYAQSWKGDEGAPAMLRALAEQEGAAGTLRLGIARQDGRPVAAQLWLVENGRATIHKLAYAEDAKALSPGTILSHAMFRAAIDEDAVTHIDFGTGDDPYKRDWMDRAVPLLRIDAYNPRTLRGLAGAARAAVSALVRRAARR
ncbi:GNAT family N-acetyltransferase [Allosphingosinicella indica]|uniref:Acetyltransferase involved in cellulose biosynthesis, CelD/BcsL family n=1 Tax=Allosphingosinicella indica TaxID=941907 RepID=A0A1X7GXC3_9SPHN|nr:GNAT family N-acetyltransferase [Allosphingosinicella indica]SMF75359.1 Acetyltransferase involved in cellulose biosynthesis, CelD/BcsL family [Allosphingosinicella indica]